MTSRDTFKKRPRQTNVGRICLYVIPELALQLTRGKCFFFFQKLSSLKMSCFQDQADQDVICLLLQTTKLTRNYLESRKDNFY